MGSPSREITGRGQDLLDLVDWRRRVGDLYRVEGPTALEEFRRGRDHLFRTHPQSPIEDPEGFAGLDYFQGDPDYRAKATFEPAAEPTELVIDTGGEDGAIRYRRAGLLRFTLAGTECSLLVLSLMAYGGGLFLPFKDATSRTETYGGGRYLFDTAKNHLPVPLLETGETIMEIDFNYAYNPSCAYSPRWACPLAPPENVLPIPVRAGEKNYRH
ncbi:MAG TPA: DUF1684 domain-containing protein [Candidatus Dormibacteraeota bacterium]|jgi:uncharacterized protein (DUF1684 family)